MATPSPPSPPSEPIIFPTVIREYEFGEAENSVFSALASQMRFVGTAQGAAGVFLVLVAITHVWMEGPPALLSSVPMAISAAMLVVTGMWLRGASEPVARIVRTEGNDIRNLMEAMTGLARMFSLQRIYLITVFTVMVLGVIGVVVAMMFVIP